MAIGIKTPKEIESMRAANKIVAATLDHLHTIIKPGISLLEIDKICEDMIVSAGAKPAFKGLYGYFFRHCNTLPLSSNYNTMKNFNHAIDTILKRGDIVLIYPEQAMWWNYRKPRPLKAGAFRYASKTNVHIVPCFITMSDSTNYDKDGFKIQEYTVNFLKPIFPDTSLNLKDSSEKLSIQNYQMWKEVYEETYKIPLTYEE